MDKASVVRRLRGTSALDWLTIAVLLLAVYLFVKPGSPLNSSVQQWLAFRRTEASAKRNWNALAVIAQPAYTGNATPEVIEFSDYECPFCRAAEPVVDTALSQGLRIAVVQLPLKIHAHARPAALAALCAQLVGQFIETHRFLMTTTAWQSDSSLQTVGNTMQPAASARFNDCMTHRRVDGALARQLALADSLKVPGTPLFVSARGILSERVSVTNLMLLGGRR